MKAIEQLKSRLIARADANGDGKVDKQDVETVIDQMQAAFADDKIENIGWVLIGFVLGVAAKWFLGMVF